MSLSLLARRVCACQLIPLLSWQREPLNLCAAVVMEALGTAGGGGWRSVCRSRGVFWCSLHTLTPRLLFGGFVRPKELHLEFPPQPSHN